MSTTNQDRIRDGITVKASASDLKNPKCPSCYSNNTHLSAHANVDTHVHNVYNCTDCSTLFTHQQGGMRALVDQIASVAGTTSNNISIHSLSGSPIGVAPNSSVTAAKIDMTNFSLAGQTVNSNDYTLQNEARTQTQEIRNLKYALDGIAIALKEIVQQNHALQEKLATDPLIGLRDKINKFEIK